MDEKTAVDIEPQNRTTAHLWDLRSKEVVKNLVFLPFRDWNLLTLSDPSCPGRRRRSQAESQDFIPGRVRVPEPLHS
ncbi:unnamed protein product [Pleuronectes platessa]|uniref:Uncharacterized protein n=1 Tax=Pleuronectes platessa TaxID=8262 RepID=A0A9N7UCA1_PLEPL|nr:unnamed protein product [Pleuronectes platessa]